MKNAGTSKPVTLLINNEDYAESARYGPILLLNYFSYINLTSYNMNIYIHRCKFCKNL
uniref:Uncharacterized protein n=1 Tax=Heterorhabditis bacteriophora TaxID=37862 RepID=A0A1I7X397_HETBA